MSLSVVIPVFRATDTLVRMVDLLLAEPDIVVERIVLVFDDGRPAAWETAAHLARLHPRVVAVRLNRNFGQHNATICGFNHCTGDFIVTMDEDLQHHPEDIKYLLDEQRKGDHDLVYGAYGEREHQPWRNLTSSILKTMLRSGLPGLHPTYTSFRLIRLPVAMQVVGMKNPYTFLDGYLTWITSSVSARTIMHRRSEVEGSSYSFPKLLAHTVNILFNFTDLPLRALTVLSVLTLLVSTVYAVYVVVTAFFVRDYLLGFPTLVALMGFGFGMLLLGLTVLVQYIARINEKTTSRPTFVVREVVE